MPPIPAKLATLTQQENLHFLLAVESGSRAWGFASPDSDYDVRALYIRPSAHYLAIDEGKDTFEFIEDEWFDVGAWDIRKALRLLRKSNAVLLEWLRSPAGYAAGSAFVLSVAAMIGLSFIVSICSSIDAFFALAYARSFTTGSILSFLLAGPMVDIKLIMLMKTTFRWRFIVAIVLIIFALSFAAGIGVNLYAR